MNEQVNEQLVLLQKELSRLKNVTDHIDNAKTNSSVIIQELEQIQQNYAQYTDELFTLYKQGITDLKEDINAKIENDIKRVEEIGDRINNTNQELIVETKNLLEHYEDVVDASDTLVDTLNTIDFHEKLDEISAKADKLIETGENSKETIKLKINETQKLITEENTRLKENIEQLVITEVKKCKELVQEHTEHNFVWQEKQEKEIKSLKLYALIICGLIILNIIITFITK